MEGDADKTKYILLSRIQNAAKNHGHKDSSLHIRSKTFFLLIQKQKLEYTRP